MRISVFGLGYVGTIYAGCLARRGHVVVGVDPNASKVELVNSGKPPVIESELAEIVAAEVASSQLRAVTDPTGAVEATQLSFVCLGTPSQVNGDLSTIYLRRVCEQIGEALRTKDDFHVVVISSTVLPGTTEELVIPTLEEFSDKRVGKDFGVCVNPEFLREGTAVHDFDNPPKIIIGCSDTASGDLLAGLYQDLDAPLIRADIVVAEAVKLADNAWHALKVGFANEIGNIAKSQGIDSHVLMDIFCQDTKLNLSSSYLKPGQAFGGSCLPKDLRALNHRARSLDLDVPILDSILRSNRGQMERSLQLVLEQKKRKIGVLGFSFKAATDDLRESPVVELVERLLGKGFDVRLYDRSVNLAKLTGANREFLHEHIPHISRLMVGSIQEVLEHGEAIVVGNYDPEFKCALDGLRDDQVVVDLVRVAPGRVSGDGYAGICW